MNESCFEIKDKSQIMYEYLNDPVRKFFIKVMTDIIYVNTQPKIIYNEYKMGSPYQELYDFTKKQLDDYVRNKYGDKLCNQINI